MPARRARRRPVLALAITLLIAASACDTPATGPITSGPVTRASDVPTITRVPQQTAPSASDPASAAAIGPWRRVPFVVDPSFGAAQEAGCRHGPVSMPSSATRVVTDVRGEGRILLVFVTSTKVFLCVTSVDHPESPTDLETLQIPSTPLADDGIDLVFFIQTGTGASTIDLAVGRVGPTPASVIAGFVDQTFVFGALGGGWYSLWWPPTVACQGIAAVDAGHVVLNTAHAPCEPGATSTAAP